MQTMQSQTMQSQVRVRVTCWSIEVYMQSNFKSSYMLVQRGLQLHAGLSRFTCSQLQIKLHAGPSRFTCSQMSNQPRRHRTSVSQTCTGQIHYMLVSISNRGTNAHVQIEEGILQ